MDHLRWNQFVVRKRRYVASLAAFLVAGAILPAACAPQSEPPEARAVELVRRFNGRIVRDSEEQGGAVGKVDLATRPFTDADIGGLTGLAGLHDLILRDTLVTDAGLARLKLTRRLRLLDLDDASITDGGLSHLAALPSLRGLYLAGTRVSDAGLQALRPLIKLRALGLGRTGITDAGLVHLVGFTELRVLDLRGTRVSGAGLPLLKGLNKLRRLYVSESQQDSAGGRELQAALPSVKLLR
jgi:hypothetical protein